MCELLGVSSNLDTSIEYSSQSMMAHSATHKHGWGVAFYPENSSYCRVFKEPKAMKDSELFQYVQKSKAVRSKIILNHIRMAAGGEPMYANTHPFVRELFGQDWVLIHNGGFGIDKFFRGYLEKNPNMNYVPLGTTGSEKALCIILNEIKKQIPSQTRSVVSGNSLAVRTDYDFAAAQQVIYETCKAIKEAEAALNILLSNGEYVIAFYGGHNTLHYILRDGAEINQEKTIMTPEALRYFQRIQQVPVSLEKQIKEKAAIIATEKLTEEEGWNEFYAGDFLVFKDGEIVFSRIKETPKEEQWIQNIEVYDTAAGLDNLNTAVIGIPKKLRDKLGIELGEHIMVNKYGSDTFLKLTVHQTDHRLLLGGQCQADSPDSHVCIPRDVRIALGLDRIESSTRSSLPAFSRKYSPVDIRK